MRRNRLRSLAALGCALAIGCGGSDGPEPLFTPDNTGREGSAVAGRPVHERGDSSVSATVGPAGGVLELGNGAKLEIPSGALGDEVELIFGLGTTTQAFSNREFERTIGPTLLVQPAVVTQPGARITLSAPLGSIPQPFSQEDVTLVTEELDEMDPMSAVRNSVQTIWQYNPASVRNGRLVAELSELPGMRLQFLLSKSEN